MTVLDHSFFSSKKMICISLSGGVQDAINYIGPLKDVLTTRGPSKMWGCLYSINDMRLITGDFGLMQLMVRAPRPLPG